MSEILALIPARGGSKGLPNKNILTLLGHPLIAYSIQAASESPSITRTIVSTDSQQIADISLKYGAEVPFLRPSEFSGDLSTDLEVFRHALGWLKEHENYVPEFVIQLRPTSPVRFVSQIEECVSLLKNSSADSLRIVTRAFHTPYKMWKVLDKNSPMKPLLDLPGVHEPFNQPRQQLPDVYWQIGTLDVIRTSVITEQNSMSGTSVLPFIVDQNFAVDIDDLAGFERAAKVIENNDCVKFGK